MFSLAYVILPFSDEEPATAITGSLARFRSGQRGDIPDDWLRFHDETAEVRRCHEVTFNFNRGQGLGTTGEHSWYLNSTAILEEMDRRGKREWSVRFADIEPDLDRFAQRFMDPFERHPVTGAYGFWLNGLGRWDWWDLGGRFNGAITGERRAIGRARTAITSGPSRGRAVLEKLVDRLGDALQQPVAETIDVHTDENVELISRLRDEAARDALSIWPGAVVLPPGDVPDGRRWLTNWPQLGPGDALDRLGLCGAEWRDVVRAVLDRYSDHWAGGVAFHH